MSVSFRGKTSLKKNGNSLKIYSSKVAVAALKIPEWNLPLSGDQTFRRTGTGCRKNGFELSKEINIRQNLPEVSLFRSPKINDFAVFQDDMIFVLTIQL